MSTTRLTFLYPHLFRSARLSDSAAKSARARSQAPRLQCQLARSFVTSERRARQSSQRHGKAVEPIPIGSGSSGGTGGVDDPKILASGEEEVKEGENSKELKTDVKPTDGGKDNPKNTAPTPMEETLLDRIHAAESTSELESKTLVENPAPQQPASNASSSRPPLETVLQMPPPETQDQENATKPPHLHMPPYVHHFDTYTLVQQVEAGEFTTAQSITSMKAVRALLANNLDVAKAGLVSKSDVENESYLFRAACSELRTEIQNHRKAKEETMRRERTLLQHEVDILNQKLTQELLTLKDDLKGMFDDRRMAVRMEQRAMESKIQELNYKITVALNSDSKSEVEGLRWVLTRRSVMGILFMAVMVLTSLRYASYKAHEEEMKKKKEVAPEPEEPIADLPAHGAAEILAAN